MAAVQSPSLYSHPPKSQPQLGFQQLSKTKQSVPTFSEKRLNEKALNLDLTVVPLHFHSSQYRKHFEVSLHTKHWKQGTCCRPGWDRVGSSVL